MAKRRPFTLRFAPETVEHVAAVDKKHHALLRRTIHEQLNQQPLTQTRNRKPLEQTGPFGAPWELRCGPDNRFRVFYDVDAEAHEVNVLAIGVKDRNRLFIGGEEYKP